MPDVFDDERPWWLPLAERFATPELLGAALVVLLIAALAVVVLAVVAFLALRRRPNFRRAALRWRSEYVASGPVAAVLDLRLAVQDELVDARRSVAAARKAGDLVGDLPDVLERLQRSAERLDVYLEQLERDLEGGGNPRRIVDAREQADQVIRAARDVRRAALTALDATTMEEVRVLTRDVRREVEWVQDGVDALAELGGQPDRGRGRRDRERPSGLRRAG